MLGLSGDAVAAPAPGLSPGGGVGWGAPARSRPRPLSPQEVRAWQGENSLLQRALEETAQGGEEEEEEDKMKKSQVKHQGPGWLHMQLPSDAAALGWAGRSVLCFPYAFIPVLFAVLYPGAGRYIWASASPLQPHVCRPVGRAR